jgi:hypothetical protein
MTNRLQVTAINPSYPAGAWHLDRPGMAPPVTAEPTIYLELAGWITATTPDPIHAIAIYANNLHRSPILVTILHPRQDVAQAMSLPPDTPCGFHAFLNVLGLQTLNSIELHAVTLGEWDRFIADSSYHAGRLLPVVTIDFAFSPGPLPEPLDQSVPDLQPLFITSLGRSGSTALMAALATNAAIASPEAYPFESKPLAYALHMARLATSPSMPHLPVASAQFLDVPFIGSTNPNLNPGDYPRLFDHYRQHGLTIFRAHARSHALAHLPPTAQPPRYIAEKSAPNTLTPMLAELVWPNTTELILCRNLTTWIASALSFSRAADRYFGNTAPLDEIVPQIITDLAAFCDYLVMRAPRALFVQYETLVTDAHFIHRLTERLGLGGAEAMAASIEQIPPGHRTIRTNDSAVDDIMASPAIQTQAARFAELTTTHAANFI